jgi:hypothetical protein
VNGIALTLLDEADFTNRVLAFAAGHPEDVSQHITNEGKLAAAKKILEAMCLMDLMAIGADDRDEAWLVAMSDFPSSYYSDLSTQPDMTFASSSGSGMSAPSEMAPEQPWGLLTPYGSTQSFSTVQEPDFALGSMPQLPMTFGSDAANSANNTFPPIPNALTAYSIEELFREVQLPVPDAADVAQTSQTEWLLQQPTWHSAVAADEVPSDDIFKDIPWDQFDGATIEMGDPQRSMQLQGGAFPAQSLPSYVLSAGEPGVNQSNFEQNTVEEQGHRETVIGMYGPMDG